MEIYKKVYTLYSDEKNRIILNFCHRTVPAGFKETQRPEAQLLLMVNGQATVSFANGNSLELCDGDLFLFDENRDCSLEINKDSEFISLKLNFSDFIDSQYRVLDKDILNRFFVFLNDVTEKMYGININSHRIQDILYLIENEFENRSLCSTYVIKAHICVIFSLIMQYYLSEPDPSAVNKAVHYKDIEKALVYINENINEKIELSTLAKIANMGKTNFSITFKKVTGMTVWEYILNTRIELAANYLIEKKDKYNITEIAFMSGFNNSAHFNKTFKKLKGKTPSDFKNSHENPCFF